MAPNLLQVLLLLMSNPTFIKPVDVNKFYDKTANLYGNPSSCNMTSLSPILTVIFSISIVSFLRYRPF